MDLLVDDLLDPLVELDINQQLINVVVRLERESTVSRRVVVGDDGNEQYNVLCGSRESGCVSIHSCTVDSRAASGIYQWSLPVAITGPEVLTITVQVCYH